LPASSTATTVKRWRPGWTSNDLVGLHLASRRSSSRQRKIAGSDAPRWKTTGIPLLFTRGFQGTCPRGPKSIMVWGGVVSIANTREAGVGSVLPAGSVARASKLRLEGP
jgi:hypothetical protein